MKAKETIEIEEELNSLRCNVARLKAIVNAQPECVKIVSRDYCLIDMNNEGLSMIDAETLDQVIGANLLEIIDPKYSDRFRRAVDAAYAGISTEIEFYITGLKGTRRRMSQRSAPIFSSEESDKVVEMVAVTRDVTEQHLRKLELIEAKKLAEEANKVKSNFLATMSHEFRTPLNAILGFTEIMQMDRENVLKDNKFPGYIKDIHLSGQYLLDLVNDVLDISEIEAAKRIYVKEKIDVRKYANICSNALSILASRNNISLDVDISESLPEINADMLSFKQILINLLSNAIKFSPEGSHVLLSAHSKGDDVIISVKDDGIGIAKECLKDITSPFYRSDSNPETAASGTGLGLSIVKSLVDAHGGELDIHSQLGIGTNVEFTMAVYHG